MSFDEERRASATTTDRASALRGHLRANRRPVVFTALSVACLALHHVLLRAMAHGHVAHVLLGAGNAPPPAGAAALAITLVIVRFVLVMLVPGLLLAAAAEIVAYLLVGPKGSSDLDDPTIEPAADDG
ncbi:MAG: hypothetical protein BGO98_00160 [Myxococcales bacterium 68-20]|nr:hypothetical protein [Myxococcales bacterium]OJY17353.1 MAG: hypothetical protein BGO98_00160 [Myxococcales bacterium 68-20]